MNFFSPRDIVVDISTHTLGAQRRERWCTHTPEIKRDVDRGFAFVGT